MAVLLSGKEVSDSLRSTITDEVSELKKKGVTPGLAVIIVGDDPASKIYVRNKKNACAATGIYSEEHALDTTVTEKELLNLIKRLNGDNNIHGILLQLPLPPHLDEGKMLLAISPGKDVDGFHPVNVGKMVTGAESFLPCTPAGVMEILDYYKIDPSGKDCVIIGRSNIVGKPQSMLMLRKNATVTVCHSKTKNLAEKCAGADILVAAIGKAKFVGADMVKEGAVVIDVGINRLSDGSICGDVDFEAVRDKASYITPVPGGVGPMTITMLLKNTLNSAKEKAGKQ